MNGNPAPVVPPSNVVVDASPQVLVSYARDAEGHRFAWAIVQGLRQFGCDVSSDHDLPLRNPTSLPAWMDEQIANRVVVCVLSDGYVSAFEEMVADVATPHRGVRYELRAVRQRIYDHEHLYDCPVIPVVSHTFDIDLVPSTFRSLDICRIDFDTSDGLDQLAARIAILERRGGRSAAVTTAERVPPSGRRRDVRQLVHELAAELSAERAISLVRECLEQSTESAVPWELVHAFPQLEEVIKDHGQVELLRELTAKCLDVVQATPHLLRPEIALASRLLICGQAWHLQRDHELSEALEAAMRGIRLAEQAEDPRIAAFGRQSVGRIHRLLAEDARGATRDQHLSASTKWLGEATALFEAIDGSRGRRSEVGACISLSARTQLSRYRLLHDREALVHADELAGRADDLLPAQQRKDRFDLKILQAELLAANRRYGPSQRLLSNVIESLITEPGDRYSEILARAYQARASVVIATRAARNDVLADLEKARNIFLKQKLIYATANSEWSMLKTDSKSMTTIKITRADTLQLESLSTDPRIRLKAIDLWESETSLQTGHRPSAHKANWATLVDRCRY